MASASVLYLAGDGAEALAAGRALRLEAYPCHVARSAAEALALLRRRRRIGAVLADWASPAGRVVAERLAEQGGDTVRASVGAGAPVEGIALRLAPGGGDDELRALARAALAQHALLRRSRGLATLLKRRTRQLASVQARARRDDEQRTRSLAEANVRLREAALGAVRLLSAAVEHADPDLAERTDRVARLAVALGRRLGANAALLEDLRVAATLRDLGHLALPRELVARAATLEGAELERWQEHADRGARLLEPLPFSRGVVAGVRYHHERWDGRGFPCGLTGSETPLVARIVAVADAYVELVTGGPGRRPLDAADAQAELIRSAGRRHDPEVVAALLRHVAESERRAADQHDEQLAGSHA